MASDELKVLMEIKGELQSINSKMNDLREDLRTDRTWVWRILALTIIGAFALIGVKLAFP